MNKSVIMQVDPASEAAGRMMNLLWDEIQARYNFSAPNPFSAAPFAVERSAFWIALIGNEPVGSVALTPLSAMEAELDIMYVMPAARGTGIAHELMAGLEHFARKNQYRVLKLRTGLPQPEALRFYEKEGFCPTPVFGRWIGDQTALCFQKQL